MTGRAKPASTAPSSDQRPLHFAGSTATAAVSPSASRPAAQALRGGESPSRRGQASGQIHERCSRASSRSTRGGLTKRANRTTGRKGEHDETAAETPARKATNKWRKSEWTQEYKGWHGQSVREKERLSTATPKRGRRKALRHFIVFSTRSAAAHSPCWLLPRPSSCCCCCRFPPWLMRAVSACA